MTQQSKTAIAIAERLANAEKRVQSLKAKKADLEAKQRKREAESNRAADTRRKILIGAYVLSGTSPEHDAVIAGLDGYLTEDRDRALFDLELKSPTPANEPDGVQDHS